MAALGAPNFPTRQPPSNIDDATAALALVSETAAAIRQLEQQSAQAVARAHNAANAVMEELERTESRAQHAEMALPQAEAEIAELSTAAMQGHEDIETLQSRLAAKEAKLVAMEQRATVAERRADDAEDAIQSIVTAIRTQLPVRSGVVAEQAGEAA
jgi:chromosome segregation ATPase